MNVIATVRIALGIVLVLAGVMRCGATLQTTTTTYQYNADGAVTAVTTQVDGQQPSTIYFTWDDFVPNTVDPTTGTVLAGNGNLSGFGPTPGSAFSAQFQYDQRNRLIGAAPSGAQSVGYTYYPASLMASSTLASGDQLGFFYDTASNAQVTNIHQPSTGAWSSYLGNTTYLSDGSEQMRCEPRKDSAGVYDPVQQSFTPTRYDPFGTTVAGGASTDSVAGYDLQQNPFRYAEEYQDPTWGGYYLRARWYLPPYQTFLQRDRGDPVHRYSYTAGNPVGRVDPSGMHSVEEGARKFLHALHANQNGWRGSLSRFFLGGIIGVTQIIANPSGYWHEIVRDSHDLTIFLALGVFAEVGTSGVGPFFDPGVSTLTSFAAHHVIDLEIGTGQALVSARRKHGRFDWASFGQGMEYTTGGIFWGRQMMGFGYKPFGLTQDDVSEMADRHFAGGQNQGRMLVFRTRVEDGILPLRGTAPWREWSKVGGYHEAVVAVGPDWSLSTEVAEDGADMKIQTRWKNRDAAHLPYMSRRTMMFVGSYEVRDVEDAFGLRQWADKADSEYNRNDMDEIKTVYRNYSLTNNCHAYARRVVSSLGR